MGVSLKTENEDHAGRLCKHRVAKAGGEASQALRGLIIPGGSPDNLRPPHRLPKAGYRGVAPSLFSFERDPHARAGKVEFQKAQLLQILSMQLYHREYQGYGF
jgi:hypothetical protein